MLSKEHNYCFSVISVDIVERALTSFSIHEIRRIIALCLRRLGRQGAAFISFDASCGSAGGEAFGRDVGL